MEEKEGGKKEKKGKKEKGVRCKIEVDRVGMKSLRVRGVSRRAIPGTPAHGRAADGRAEQHQRTDTHASLTMDIQVEEGW